MRLLVFTGLTALFGLLAPAVAGLLTNNYRAGGQYISELGARGAPQGDLVNYGIFLPTAVLTLVSVIWLAMRLLRHQRIPALLLLGLAVGNLGAALWPCDAGCPAEGSAQQGLHNLLGLVQYASGGVALIWMGLRAHFPLGVVFGIVVFACLYLMGGPGVEFRGLWQRVAELCLYTWLPLSAWRLTRPLDMAKVF